MDALMMEVLAVVSASVFLLQRPGHGQPREASEGAGGPGGRGAPGGAQAGRLVCAGAAERRAHDPPTGWHHAGATTEYRATPAEILYLPTCVSLTSRCRHAFHLVSQSYCRRHESVGISSSRISFS